MKKPKSFPLLLIPAIIFLKACNSKSASKTAPPDGKRV